MYRKVTKQCPNCLLTFLGRPDNKHCSRSCAHNSYKLKQESIDPNQPKQCSKCREFFPLESFNKDSKRASGRRSHCRNCTRLYLVRWKVNNGLPEKHLESVKHKIERESLIKDNPELKFCFCCKQFHNKTNFNKSSQYPDGLYPTCIDCRKKYRIDNREILAARQLQYRVENRETYLKRGNVWRQNNREKNRVSIRRHYSKNKESYILRSKHRRALKISAAGSYTLDQWQSKLRYFGYRCYLCGKDLNNEVIHAEHRIPLSKGGSNWISNIAPSCQFCNFSKHDKTEKEFQEWKKRIGACEESNPSQLVKRL